MQTCVSCGVELDEDNTVGPNPDLTEDEPMCWECYDEEFCFVCDRCECFEHQDHEDFFAAHQPVRGFDGSEVRPGVYEVLARPFYTESVFDAWIHEDRVYYVGPVTHLEGEAGYPCAFICRACADDYRGAPLWWYRLKQRLLLWKQSLIDKWKWREP